ncbi:P-loop NTPase [Desulfatiferula olefinivorans]
MKIIICGKGGSGKSTVSVMLARALARRNYRVLLIDADESNLGLHRLLGVDAPTVILDSLGGKRGMRERLKDPLTGERVDLFEPDLAWDALGRDCVAEADGVFLASVGKIREAGEGCACPMGRLSRDILSRLRIGERDMVVIDTSAGIEHFGRGVDAHADLIVGVVDPSYESVLLSEKIRAMADKERIASCFVLNRIDARGEGLLRAEMKAAPPVASLPFSDAVFQAGLTGEPVRDLPPGIETLCEVVLRKQDEKGGRHE